jgi:hypothetical protein
LTVNHVDIAYYDKTTTNDIVNVSASETSGYGVHMRTWEKLPTVVLKCLFRALKTQNINGRIFYNNGKVATNANLIYINKLVVKMYKSVILWSTLYVIYGTSYARNDDVIIYEIDSDGFQEQRWWK